MTLKEALSCVGPSVNIRVGCRNGQGFIYMGPAGDICYPELNKASRARVVRVTKANRKIEKEDVEAETERRLAAWVPTEDRKVIDMSYGIQEPALVYCIEGSDTGKQYNYRAKSKEKR